MFARDTCTPLQKMIDAGDNSPSTITLACVGRSLTIDVYGNRLLFFSFHQTYFRPVAMMVPDYSLIAEIILYSEGFEEAKVRVVGSVKDLIGVGDRDSLLRLPLPWTVLSP